MSDEVSQFLEQVGRLRDQQIEEDEVRARKLEEYLAAKRERQARRAERARSISPQKSSPANTPSPRSSSRRSLLLSDASRLDSPGPRSDEPASRETSLEPVSAAGGEADAMGYSSSPTKENESPNETDSKRGSVGSMPARSSTLSWQQRPKSRGGSRPLSMVAAQNATQRSLAGTQESPASSAEKTLSRDQIAQALGSKDPTWFRQTADRGQGSAAYRRSQVEDEDRLDMASSNAQLPGMSADTSRDKPPSRSSTPSGPPAGLASPIPLNPPRFDGTIDDRAHPDRTSTASPGGRTSPLRSTSPTKGMGGFVQSAMMKRSDSVKRWSVTSPPGLTRADSIASNRGAYDRNSSLMGSRPQSTVRGGSTTPVSSRPTSLQIETQDIPDITPTASSAERAPSPAQPAQSPKREDDDAAIPSSPSKTMDSRRWSPTKSSWLESALNKPESPKLPAKPQTPSSQPAWRTELNKREAGSADADKRNSSSHKHQVSIGGLMRSAPMGAGSKPNATGLGGIYSPPTGGNKPTFDHNPLASISKNVASPLRDKGEADSQDPDKTEELHEESSAASPPPVKPKQKPETPPKKDFRANLKPRNVDYGASRSTEPEFKNVFGNLRKTKTQNYRAPDELKDNILRGKAGLATTGGPKKTERKDEFKEAILKKKDGFKKAQADGKGITRSATMNLSQPVPEGLAKRAELGRSSTLTKSDSVDLKSPLSTKKADSPKPSPGPKRISSQSISSPKATTTTSSSIKDPGTERLKRVSTEPQRSAADAEPRALPMLQKETSAPSKLQQRGAGGGKLADRFNPALAGMLARGPPPVAANGGRGNSEESSTRGKPSSGDSSEPSAPGPQLTHMTKNRARGPRRKAPTGSATQSSTSEKPSSQPPPTSEAKRPLPVAPVSLIPESVGGNDGSLEEREVKAESVEEKPPGPKPEPKKTALSSIQQQVAAKAAIRGKPTPASPPPRDTEQKKETEAKRPVSIGIRAAKVDVSSEKDVSTKSPPPVEDEPPQPGSPKKLNMKRMSRFFDEAPQTPDPKPESTPEPKRLFHQRTGSRSPVKMAERPLPDPAPSSPTKVDSEPVASVKSSASMFGGAVVKSPPPGPKPVFEKSPKAETPRIQKRVSKPLPMTPSEAVTSPQSVNSPVRTPSKQANELSTLLNDFFGTRRPRPTYKVDAAEVLTNRPQSGTKVKSTGAQMIQITGDGKKLPVPAHYERILFEREMYVCAHDFITEAGKKMLEVYFWVGDEVPESTADDAQLFAQREARALGGRLIRLEQGKETAEFLQALGGVIIIRRGSSNKYDSLAPNMLCGRRYMGQVAFDEVDFTPSSLCAGFPFLINQAGKCYLWKGKGADVEELSGARLVGMDLTLTGELIEYEDGSEPESFWEMFDGGSKPHSADHWRLKPNYSKYCSRLFCSDSDSRQQIYEISPFTQADLSPSSIYVLDAFFEMYVVVGSRAQSQYASFRNALDFAQEYAILAAGMEDRPFMPVSTVVLEGIPRDLKSVFRKWSDARSPTLLRQIGGGGLKRGRSLRVVPLTQALQALSD